MVTSISEEILALEGAYCEGELHPHLKCAIDLLNEFHAELTRKSVTEQLSQLNKRIDCFLTAHKDSGITYTKEEHGPFHQTHNFNGVYRFYLTDIDQVEAFDRFLDFVLVELIDQIDAKPAAVVVTDPNVDKVECQKRSSVSNVVGWSTISEANWSIPVECTPSTGEVEHDSGDFQRPITTIEVDNSSSEIPEEILLDPEEIELQKKKNVEHLNRVRSGIDKMAEERRQMELKIRTDAIATVIANNHNTVARLIKVTTAFLKTHPESTIPLSEIMQEIATHDFVSDPAIIRTVIKLTEINLKAALVSIPTIVIDSSNTIGLLPYSSKAHLAYITVCNLAVVRAHESIRAYSVFELITYMLDYCETTSSLNIADTPEEIVELMSGVYDIFVSNALNPEFVYNSATAQSITMADTWYQTNPLVTHYLSKIPPAPISDSVLKSIAELYSDRNTLMSQQSLDRANVVKLRDMFDKLWITQQSNVVCEYHESLGSYVIAAREVGPYEHVCIVIDNLGVMSYVSKDTSMSYQKNYDVNQTAELLRWLNILL